MLKLIAIACLMTASAFAAPAGSSPPAGDPLIDEVIALSKAHALNGQRPDWVGVEAEADALAADPTQGRTVAIRHVLRALRDGHSFYMPPAQSADRKSRQSIELSRVPLPIAVADQELPGRLVINTWSGPQSAIPDATRAVRTALIDASSPCGVIIDVARNTGGNMWPMMGGIAPLYDDTTILSFESREGRRNPVSVVDGQLAMSGRIFPVVDDLAAMAAGPRRIAIIIGPKTASSGEILALGFRGQSNARLFGQRTMGATSANRTMPLSNGGRVALTTSRLVDRAGAAQVGPLVPDVTTDEPLVAAAAWLAESCDAVLRGQAAPD